MSNKHPEPGSPAAVARGCTCPPHTAPDDLIVDSTCPIHATEDWVEPCPHGHTGPENCPACNPD